MSIKNQGPIKFRPYLTLDGHVKRWPADPDTGREFVKYICQNSPRVSANTSRFLCEFLSFQTVSVGRDAIDTLLNRRNNFRIHKSFYQWILKHLDSLSGDNESVRQQIVRHIESRHPRLLDKPIYTKAEHNKVVAQLNKALAAPTKLLTGKRYAITGTLPINRAEAIEAIQNAGGKYSQSLNRDVILIVGEPTSGTTVKQRTAKRYKNKTIKWDELIKEITPPPVAAEPEKSTHPTFQSVMDWLLSDKDNIHKTLEAIELVDVKANCEQF